MSTNCLIGLQSSSGIRYIYCHSNSYPNGIKSVGTTLLNYYKTTEKIQLLLNLLDISFLGKEPVDEPRLWSTFWLLSEEGRDCISCRTYAGRGEVTPPHHCDTLLEYAEACDQYDYGYLFRESNQRWYLIRYAIGPDDEPIYLLHDLQKLSDEEV